MTTTTKKRTKTVSVKVAAEHYADAFRRGREGAVVEARLELIRLLQDDTFHDEVDAAWKEDKTIYEAIVDTLLKRGYGVPTVTARVA